MWKYEHYNSKYFIWSFDYRDWESTEMGVNNCDMLASTLVSKWIVTAKGETRFMTVAISRLVVSCVGFFMVLVQVLHSLFNWYEHFKNSR